MSCILNDLYHTKVHEKEFMLANFYILSLVIICIKVLDCLTIINSTIFHYYNMIFVVFTIIVDYLS